MKPHGHGFNPGDGDTKGQRKKHSCMCWDWARAQPCGWLQGTVNQGGKADKKKTQLHQSGEEAMGTQGLNSS